MLLRLSSSLICYTQGQVQEGYDDWEQEFVRFEKLNCPGVLHVDAAAACQWAKCRPIKVVALSTLQNPGRTWDLGDTGGECRLEMRS